MLPSILWQTLHLQMEELQLERIVEFLDQLSISGWGSSSRNQSMPLSAQFKDGWDTWVLPTVCPTVFFVPQEPLAAAEAPNLKYLEG